MSNKLTRLLAVLMSVLMLAMPTLASAGATSIYLTISDPKITASGTTLDFSGLTVELSGEQAEDLTHILLNVLAAGEKAATVHASFGDKGLQAYVEGMSSAFIVTAEAIKELGDQMAQNYGMDSMDDMASMSAIDPSTLFSEEAMAEYMGKVQGIVGSVITGSPEEDTFVNLAGEETAAVRYDFTLTGKQIAALVEATAELIDSSEELSARFGAALAAQGMEGTFKDNLQIDPEELPTVSGSVYVSTASQDVHAEGDITVEDSSAPFTVDFTMNDDGMLATGSIKEPDDGSEELAFQVSVTPSATVSGEVTVLAECGLYDTEDGAVVTESYITLSIYAEPAANDSVTRIFLLNAGSDDTTIILNASFNGDPENEMISVSISANDYGDESLIALAFNGKAVDFENGAGHEGTLTLSFLGDGESASLSAEVAIGTRVGESIAFDFSSLPAIDVTTLNEDNSQSVLAELQTLAQTALMKLMNVPGVAALMSSMQG